MPNKKQPSIYIYITTLTEKHLKLVILEKKQLFIVFITSIIIIIKQNWNSNFHGFTFPFGPLFYWLPWFDSNEWKCETNKKIETS